MARKCFLARIETLFISSSYNLSDSVMGLKVELHLVSDKNFVCTTV